jgi:hypothetical protein
MNKPEVVDEESWKNWNEQVLPEKDKNVRD